MAESIIKEPFKSYVIVATTGHSSNTYKNKLQSLSSAFQNLSTSRKMKSFLYIGDCIYRIQCLSSTSVVFAMIKWGNTTHTMGNYYIIDLVTGERKEFSIKYDGTTSMVDSTNNSTESNIQLGYWL